MGAAFLQAQDISTGWIAHVESVVDKSRQDAEALGYVIDSSSASTLFNKPGTRGLRLNDNSIVIYAFCLWTGKTDGDVSSLISNVTRTIGNPSQTDGSSFKALWNHHRLQLTVNFDSASGTLYLQYGRQNIAADGTQAAVAPPAPRSAPKKAAQQPTRVPPAKAITEENKETAETPPAQPIFSDPVVDKAMELNSAVEILDTYNSVKDRLSEYGTPSDISLYEGKLKIVYPNSTTVYIDSGKYYIHSGDSVRTMNSSGVQTRNNVKNTTEKDYNDGIKAITKKYKLKNVTWENSYSLEGNPSLKGSNGMYFEKSAGAWAIINSDGTSEEI
ncbi:MAG: hypothetical protein Ta2G_01860 [Termitinemataceae bacterium]|nr:MAG: hypothetical protein Ta2G_01860 [Termitinemataceae bacterium]